MSERFYQRFQLDESLAQKTRFNPYYPELTSGLGDTIAISGERFVDLASNNYLGLAGDLRVKTAMQDAIELYGSSLCGTPIATGANQLYRLIEGKLTGFIGVESGILLPSCYQANNGLFSVIAGKEDLIIVDQLAHSSLIQGIKLVGSKIRPFLHNNLDHLEKILKNSIGKYREIFLVTESVYSTDGSIAPLAEMVKIAKEYEVILVVDDSHGLGVLGEGGRGILEYSGVEDFPGIYTASLGKALANFGGIIGGKKELITYLRYYCPHLVYSTALPPAVLAGIGAVVEIIESEFSELSKRLWDYKKRVGIALEDAGFNLVQGLAPINSIHGGGAEETFLIAKRFYEEKILVTPFIEPSVPPNAGKVRLIAGAGLREETMTEIIEIIAKINKC